MLRICQRPAGLHNDTGCTFFKVEHVAVGILLFIGVSEPHFLDYNAEVGVSEEALCGGDTLGHTNAIIFKYNLLAAFKPLQPLLK